MRRGAVLVSERGAEIQEQGKTGRLGPGRGWLRHAFARVARTHEETASKRLSTGKGERNGMIGICGAGAKVIRWLGMGKGARRFG